MIDPKELRIGNYIKIAGTEVYGIGIQAIIDINEQQKNKNILIEFEPIPITKDIIIKFGFEKDEHYWYKYIPFQSEIILFNYKTGELIIGYGNQWYKLKKTFKFVHQLQNVIFEMCNKELKFKE